VSNFRAWRKKHRKKRAAQKLVRFMSEKIWPEAQKAISDALIHGTCYVAASWDLETEAISASKELHCPSDEYGQQFR